MKRQTSQKMLSKQFITLYRNNKLNGRKKVKQKNKNTQDWRKMNYKKNPREMCERRGDEHTRNEGTTRKSQTFINWIAFVRLSMGQPLRSLFAGAGVQSISPEMLRMCGINFVCFPNNRFAGIFRQTLLIFRTARTWLFVGPRIHHICLRMSNIQNVNHGAASHLQRQRESSLTFICFETVPEAHRFHTRTRHWMWHC